MDKTQCILVTGATGYVGGRLVPRLLDAGYKIRVLVRNPSQLQGRIWLKKVEIVKGDVLNSVALEQAMEGMEAAYYLIHSMSNGKDFQKRDQSLAHAFGQAAKKAGLKRIIYLGGLGNQGKNLSPHLHSRHQIGRILAKYGIPLIEFRAAIIVGSGSAAFEMLRYTVEGLPILFCPTWVKTRIQPISVHDVLKYLIAAIRLPDPKAGQHLIVEIGGAEVLTYHDMIRGYARTRGLRRPTRVVPILSLNMCATLMHWITPIPKSLAHALIEGMRNNVVVTNNSARILFPDIKPRDYSTSLERALARITNELVETTWSDAQISSIGDENPVLFSSQEGLLYERRWMNTTLPAEALYRSFTSLGGDRGWLYANWIWLARGIVDRMVGGVGFRRGRRDPNTLRVGDALDFWRVEALEPDRLMRLRAEMKVPGLAWLQFQIVSLSAEERRLVQTAFFEPKGLPGLTYWYLLYPIHGFIFSKLIQKVVEQAKQTA